MKTPKRPGYLKQYAQHAGISRQAAADQLARVGVNYLEAFDFTKADQLRAAARHADRALFAKPIYTDEADAPESPDGDETSTDPKFIESQARREMFKAKLTELEYLERVGTLVELEHVSKEWFGLARLVRDSVLNIPARMAGLLAAESDQRKVYELLDAELCKALEGLATMDDQAA